VASVIRLNSGGSTAIEKMGLSVEQAKELATRLWEAGEPAGCAWCVRLDERTKRRLQTGLEPLERECRSTQGWQDGTMKAA
jgi:hypothetical protein